MTSSQDAAVVAALMETGLATRMVLRVEGLAEEQTSTEIQVSDVLTSIAPEGGLNIKTSITWTFIRRLN